MGWGVDVCDEPGCTNKPTRKCKVCKHSWCDEHAEIYFQQSYDTCNACWVNEMNKRLPCGKPCPQKDSSGYPCDGTCTVPRGYHSFKAHQCSVDPNHKWWW